jgi:hypothetical protein
MQQATGAGLARRTFNAVDVTEVLVHWHVGRSQSEIATSLGLDRKTVKKPCRRQAEGVRQIGWRGAWRFLAPPWRAAPGMPVGWVPVGGRSRLSKSGSGMGRSNPTALWVIDSDRATA